MAEGGEHDSHTLARTVCFQNSLGALADSPSNRMAESSGPDPQAGEGSNCFRGSGSALVCFTFRMWRRAGRIERHAREEHQPASDRRQRPGCFTLQRLAERGELESHTLASALRLAIASSRLTRSRSEDHWCMQGESNPPRALSRRCKRPIPRHSVSHAYGARQWNRTTRLRVTNPALRHLSLRGEIRCSPVARPRNPVRQDSLGRLQPGQPLTCMSLSTTAVPISAATWSPRGELNAVQLDTSQSHCRNASRAKLVPQTGFAPVASPLPRAHTSACASAAWPPELDSNQRMQPSESRRRSSFGRERNGTRGWSRTTANRDS